MAGLLDHDEAAAEPADRDVAEMGGVPSAVDLASPASEADIRRVYLDATSMGIVINGVGPATAFIAAALFLSDSEAGLHSVALAIGLIVAGIATARLDRAVGTARVHIAALVTVALSFLLVAAAPALWATLAGAAGVGLGFGTMLAHINQTMTSGGGSLARVRTARATLIAQITGLSAPIIIGIGVTIGVGWGLVALPVIVLVGLSLVFTRGRNYRPIPAIGSSRPLPRSYWTAWLLLVTLSSFESAIIFWAGPLVERRAGVPLEEAVLVFSAFLAGMVVSRFALSLPAVSRIDPVLLMRIGLAGVLLGTLAAWASSNFALSVVVLLAAGFSSGVLFPLGIAVAMETAPALPQLASSRIVLGPGLGLLFIPFIVGVVADISDVGVAWVIVPAMCVVAIGLTIPVARDRQAMAREAAGA